MAGPFVDPESTDFDEVQVPCPCEGKPHDSDTVYIRKAFSGEDVARVQGATFTITPEGQPGADVAASNLAMMELGVVGWTFVDAGGSPIPFERSMINRLHHKIWSPVHDAIDAKMDEAKVPLEQPDSNTGTDATSQAEKSAGKPVRLVSSQSSSTPSPDSASTEPERY